MLFAEVRYSLPVRNKATTLPILLLFSVIFLAVECKIWADGSMSRAYASLSQDTRFDASRRLPNV